MKKSYYSKIFSLFLLTSTLFMGIGYAALNSISLEIAGLLSAQKQDGVFISQVEYVSDINAIKENCDIISAYQTTLNSKIELSKTDGNSSVTYSVTVYNQTNDIYYFEKVDYLNEKETYSNENITFDLVDINVDDELGSKQSKTFFITFHYKDNIVSEDNILNSYINFKFNRKYDIVYENFSSTVGYPVSVYEGGELNVSFGNIDAPIEVKKGNTILDSSLYEFSNNTLIIKNVDADIHIRKLTKYTVTNLVKNGSFENGLTNWSIQGQSNSWLETHIKNFGSKGYYRVTSNAGVNYLTQSISWIINHKYYFFAYAISTSYQNFTCDITNKGGAFTVQVGPEKFTKGSSLYTSNFTGNNTISINYAKTTNNVIVDGIGVIDLTNAFGSGNEPSLSWCDSNIRYFDDTNTYYK